MTTSLILVLSATLTLAAAPSAVDRTRVHNVLGGLPVSFEENRGQVGGSVRFLSRTGNAGLYLSRGRTTLSLTAGGKGAAVHMTLSGSTRRDPVGSDELPGKSNYFIGKTSFTGLRNYSRVEYRAVYPGIDLVYYGARRQIEYDFIVAPGAKPSRIRMRFDGIDRLRVDSAGDLILDTPAGEIRQRKPLLYQVVNGDKRIVDGAYALLSAREAGFKVGRYDPVLPLIIDPVLVYSTYFGGIDDIAVDSTGSAYIVGAYPIIGGSPGGLYVTKLNPAGTAVVYATNFAPAIETRIAVDPAGNAYVTGRTQHLQPTTPGAFQTTASGYVNAFVTKLNSTGSALIYSTYLSGDDFNAATAIAVDPSGSAYVAGETRSALFPVTPGAFRTTLPPSFYATSQRSFLSKLNPAGTALSYSTYLAWITFPAGIAVDSSGNAIVTGITYSPDYPVTPEAFQPAIGATPGNDAFITKVNAAGSALIYSSYFGGLGPDDASGVAVDSAGNGYISGTTASANFPVTAGAYQTRIAGQYDLYAAKFSPSGVLVFSTFVGGSGHESGTKAHSISLDAAGNIYLFGSTMSPDFPTTPGRFQGWCGYPSYADAIVAKLSPDGDALLYSTYFCGSSLDGIYTAAADLAGSAYIAGITQSSDFPTTAGSIQPSAPPGLHGFIAKINPVCELIVDDGAVGSAGRFSVNRLFPVRLHITDCSGNPITRYAAPPASGIAVWLDLNNDTLLQPEEILGYMEQTSPGRYSLTVRFPESPDVWPRLIRLKPYDAAFALVIPVD